jgi:hypothetical protein
LNELINLRGSGQATSDDFQKNFRMIVEHHNLGGGQADYPAPRAKKDQSLGPVGAKEAKVAFDGDTLEKSQERRHQSEKSKLERRPSYDKFDLGGSQSRGDLAKPLESILESVKESQGHDSGTIRESIYSSVGNAN